MREVLPTNRGKRNYSGSKTRAREGVKVGNFFEVTTMFDKQKRVEKARSEKALNGVPDKPSQAVVREEVSPVVAKDQNVVRSTSVVQGEDGRGHKIDSCRW